jgi:hypothetical protein
VFAEFAITLADGSVWLSIAQGLIFAAVCLAVGTAIARAVGLLRTDAPAGETIGVGLASGSLVVAAWWAAIASGGRSSFTPVAAGFAVAILLAVVRRRRSGPDASLISATEASSPAGEDTADAAAPGPGRRSHLILAVLGAGAFIVAVALLYGSTLTLSPRDGIQPIEFQDEAFYSVLGADLAKSGTETIYSPSGFDHLQGLPTQTWYHWGELWLGAAVISIFGMAPVDARHFVVLPVLLLAAATLTGTIVRHLTRSASRSAFLFGFIACLFLAPVPLAVGMIFGITSYGVAAVAVLLALYGLAVLSRRRDSWGLAVFAGTAAAMIVPAHLVIALLGMVGIGSVWSVRVGRSLIATRGLPVVPSIWRRTFIATAVAVVATIVWGVLTGHGVGGSGASPTVPPFNAFWRESVAIVSIGGITFLTIAIAWWMVRTETSLEADLYLGTAVVVVVGAIVWGALLGDFITVHLFYGGIAAFVTPAAAVAVWRIWLRLRATGRTRVAIVAVVLCAAQLEAGVFFSVGRLWLFGPGDHPPAPLAILAAMKDLPADAKLAYACHQTEEAAFWDAHMLGLDAHSGRRVVPMCFQAETFGLMTGTPISPDVASPLFTWAPQRSLYPTSQATPTPAEVGAFMKANGIDYIYVDAIHPNTLVPDAVPVATSGATQVLRLP